MPDDAKPQAPEIYVSPWWQASVLPSRWDVCGFVVPALTVWHLWVLENTPPGVGSPYLSNARDPDLDDAAAVILIAQHNRVAYLDKLQWDAGRREAISKKIARRLKRTGEDQALGAVMEYVVECLRVPAHDYPVNDKGKPVRAPWQWHIVAALSGGDPARYDAAWDLPFALARSMCDVLRERQPGGDDTLADMRRQRSIDEWAALKAQGKAGA